MDENGMKNVEMSVDDGLILTIKVDLNKTHGLSKSRKSTIIATTSGIVPVPGTKAAKIGLNVFK